MATLALAWRVLCALTAYKPAHSHGHGHGGKVEKNDFLRELRHKGGCCCFEWAVYAPWACYAAICALPLVSPQPHFAKMRAYLCLGDLLADR
jgi:hypothetical protein